MFTLVELDANAETAVAIVKTANIKEIRFINASEELDAAGRARTQTLSNQWLTGYSQLQMSSDEPQGGWSGRTTAAEHTREMEP